jgi:hypothetical protein
MTCEIHPKVIRKISNLLTNANSSFDLGGAGAKMAGRLAKSPILVEAGSAAAVLDEDDDTVAEVAGYTTEEDGDEQRPEPISPLSSRKSGRHSPFDEHAVRPL